MRRVLVVAYYFPPIGGIGSIRLASLVRHLPEFGWEPTVVASAGTPHASDPSIPFVEERVVRSRSVELSRLARALPRQVGRDDGPGAARRGLRGFARGLVFPDAQIGWYPGAVIAGRRALRRTRFDLVYSSSFPVTAHLVARNLAGRAGLPWIAEFRDPWSDRLPPHHPHRSRAEALESKIAASAERVLMPTPTWAAHFGDRWGIEIDVVRNGHEISEASGVGPQPQVLTHVGSFYPGLQRLTPVWEALKRLATNESALRPRIRFVGELHPEARAEASAFGLGARVEATGFVQHAEAMRQLRSSSMLFAGAVAGDDPIARGWVPAKLYEYLGSGLPILYLGSPESDAGALLNGQPGCHVVDPEDIDGIVSALHVGLGEARQERDTSYLSRRAAAETLAWILDRATGTAIRRNPRPPLL